MTLAYSEKRMDMGGRFKLLTVQSLPSAGLDLKLANRARKTPQCPRDSYLSNRF